MSIGPIWGTADLGRTDRFSNTHGLEPTLVFERNLPNSPRRRIQTRVLERRLTFHADRVTIWSQERDVIERGDGSAIMLEHAPQTCLRSRLAFTQSVENLAVAAGATPRTG